MVLKDGVKGLAYPIQNSRESYYNTVIHDLPQRFPTPGLATKQTSCFPYKDNPYVGLLETKFKITEIFLTVFVL